MVKPASTTEMGNTALTKQEAKDRKLCELVLYIAQGCRGDHTFGVTKQNRLLFYADFLAYVNFGQLITDQEYIRLADGPEPKRWPLIREQMLAKHDIAIQMAEFQGLPQYRTMALRKPDLSFLTAPELTLVDEVIEKHRSQTEAEISKEANGAVGWKLAKVGEVIPYLIVHLTQPPVR
jgi:hypothetical protein